MSVVIPESHSPESAIGVHGDWRVCGLWLHVTMVLVGHFHRGSVLTDVEFLSCGVATVFLLPRCLSWHRDFFLQG